MADHSTIEWTDATWNPVTGCSKVSPGCKHCYAERLARRLRGMGNPRYQNGFTVTLHPDQLWLPLRWRQPRRIFVNSMSDLFHEKVPEDFIRQIFAVMQHAHWHTFQCDQLEVTCRHVVGVLRGYRSAFAGSRVGDKVKERQRWLGAFVFRGVRASRAGTPSCPQRSA